jgi:hypothetical protein
MLPLENIARAVQMAQVMTTVASVVSVALVEDIVATAPLALLPVSCAVQ